MADTYYAWAPIRHGAENDKDGNFLKFLTIAAGEKVAASDIGDDEANWQDKIESGAVRTMPYPDMPKGFLGSPLDYLREKAKEVEQLSAVGAGGSYFGLGEEAMLTGAMDLNAPTAAGSAEATPEQKKESDASVKDEMAANK